MAQGSPTAIGPPELPSTRARHRFDPVAVARGDLYALRGVVTIVEGSAERVTAIVRGTLPYDVSLAVEQRDHGSAVLVASCTCARAALGLCKHVWAALRIAEREKHLAALEQTHGDLLVASVLPVPSQEHRPELRWVIDLASARGMFDFHIDVFERSTTPLGFSTGYRKLHASRGLAASFVRGPSGPDFAALARTGRCEVLLRHGEPSVPLVADEGPPFRLVLMLEDGVPPERGLPGLVVRGAVRRGEEVISLHALSSLFRVGVAFIGGRVIKVENDVPTRWVEALRRCQELVVAPDESLGFLRELFRKCRRTSFELPPSVSLEEHVPFRTQVHVRRPESTSLRRKLGADLTFDYGGTKVASRDYSGLAVEPSQRRFIVRDADAEQAVLAELVAAGFALARGRDAAHPLKIHASRLSQAILSLPPERFVVVADGVVHRRASRTSLSVESGIDWFEVEATAEFDGVAALTPALLEAAKRGDNVIRLGDGSVGVLPERWLARLSRVSELAVPASGALRFHRAQLTLVDAALGEAADAVTWRGPLASLRTRLRDPLTLPAADPPRGFHGELRDYQRTGLAWMQWLEEIGFSGCLADDMGLGKTIQVLALLADRKERRTTLAGGGPSLVVAPRSVIYNWLDEAARFAPGLRAIELARTTAENELVAADLVVTTYGLLRRKAEELANVPFDYVVLDEAHAIKNARGATSCAVRMLRCRQRLALSGTPVENHLGELVALFDFLNPGMLGRAVRRVAREGLDLDREVAAQLGRGLRPFVLRRKKADVIKELPPRIDRTLLCTMESRQRAVYERVKKHYQAKLLGREKDAGVEARPLDVLEALLRLRQIACHPGLVDPAWQAERSAKVDVLLSHLVRLAAFGKKAIVFSQFTTLLDIVERNLDARSIPFARLDGTTPNRKEVVERFQRDPACSVFLVSLKAGGVGLNLTAANFVFLLDPWWNPAAEAQAIDRAHRMGQTKPVIAYRLLCEDSIDERVAELQERKRQLVASIFRETEGMRLGSLSARDVEVLLS